MYIQTYLQQYIYGQCTDCTSLATQSTTYKLTLCTVIPFEFELMLEWNGNKLFEVGIKLVAYFNNLHAACNRLCKQTANKMYINTYMSQY